jgi:hypothetical protein
LPELQDRGERGDLAMQLLLVAAPVPAAPQERLIVMPGALKQ